MELKCECGVYGVFNFKNAAYTCRDGLYQLQHRGEEWTGIASGFSDNSRKINLVKKPGWAEWAICENDLEQLEGDIAIGHNRYSTAGPSDFNHAQPHVTAQPSLAFCSNGDIVQSSYRHWRDFLEKMGVYFSSCNDGELLVKLIAYQLQRGLTILQAIEFIMQNILGAYSALLIYDGKLISFRDPLGIRPLVMGKRENSWLVSSETCALDIIKAEYAREIRPGEAVIFTRCEEPICNLLDPGKKCRHCVFELIYFSRPDSYTFGILTQDFRKKVGRVLSAEYPIDADIVMPVPDSSNAIALGYSQKSEIAFDFGLIRNHYVGRSFIAPQQRMRDDKVRKKFNPVRPVLQGRKVIVVDDSIVRGTTIKKIVSMLRRAGAREVHLRIGSPPVKFPCFYGINTPDREQLVASSKTSGQVREFIGADSLGYLKMKDLRGTIEHLGKNPDDFCYACFNGNYPTAL